MNMLRRIANWIDFFVSLVAAVYIPNVILRLPATGDKTVLQQVLSFEAKPAVYAGLFLALLLLLGAILRAVQHVTSAAAGRYLQFETPNGDVSVRAASVEEVINRTVRKMDQVADASVALVLPRRARLPKEARVRCRLYNRPDLLAVQDQVRAVVGQCYLEMFPGQEALPVQVSVERIIFESTPEKPKPAAEPEREESGEAEPMRPQYPVEQ